MSSIAEAVRTLYRPNTIVIEGGETVERVLKASSLRAAGARRIKFGKDEQPTDGATAYYRQDAPLLTPRRLMALVPISEWILKHPGSNDDLIDTDAAEIIALHEDLVFLRGTGTGGEPTGLMNMAGIRVLSLQKGALTAERGVLDQLDVAWGYAKDGMGQPALEAARWAAFVPWETVSALESEHGEGVVFATEQSGTLPNGLHFHGSAQIGNGRVLIANMNECVIADSDTLEVSLSTESSYTPDGGQTWESAYQNGQVLARVVWYHDLTHRRLGQVIALKERGQ